MTTLIAAIIALLVLGITLFKPIWGVWLLIIGALAVPTYFSSWSYFNIGFRLFYLDIVLLPLFALALLSGKFHIGKNDRLNHLFTYWMLYGLFSVAYSLLFFDYPINLIIGMFRRFFLYPFLIYYTIIFYSLYAEKFNLQKSLPVLFWLMIISFVLQATTRYLLKTSYMGQLRIGQYEFYTDFRALSHLEAVGLQLGLFYFIYRLISKQSPLFSLTGLLALVGTSAAIMSGFRVIWMSLVVSVFLLIFLHQVQRHPVHRIHLLRLMTRLAVLIGALTIFLSTLLPDLFGMQKDNLLGKFYTDSSGLVKIGGLGWRFPLWAQSFHDFSISPIFGRGIGWESHWFFPGVPVEKSNTPHNFFLHVAVRFGLIGLFLFISMHIKFIKYTTELIRQGVNPQFTIPLLIFYLMLFFIGLLQPSIFLLEGSAMLGVSMGLITALDIHSNVYNTDAYIIPTLH